MSKHELVPRPDYGLYNPDFKGKPVIQRLLLLTMVVLALLLTWYVVGSIIAIWHSTSSERLFNYLILLVESIFAYYSLVLLWHFAQGFAPVDANLKPVITEKQLNDGDVPTVSVLLSCYKEPLSIVEQSVKAAMDLNYPDDKYEVVVIEDGRKDNRIEDFCRTVGAKYLTRDNRKHFKAGAVNYALPKLTGDYVLFIDTDHVVERNVVANCLLAWREDTIGVQTRVDFVNLVTYLTTISAFLQIQFFSLFERGRRSTGSAVFAGGGAVFDRNLLIQQGGMQPLTIADDTDTSFTLRSDGYRIEYIDTIGVWALVPWDPLHQMRQIWRWMTGITRSFRARWLRILRGKSNLYVKIDHFTTGFFPTLAVVSWLAGFVIILMIGMDVNMIRAINPSYFPILWMVPGAATSLPVITGTLALLLDDPNISYRRKSWFTKVTTLSGFYFLVVASQPLLIGAILKGLTGYHVEFNRTPKQKQADDSGLSRIKLQYLIQTSLIFLVGIMFGYFAIQVPLLDPRQITLLVGAYAGVVPLLIALLWYWKLESYLLEVGDISALKFLEGIAQQQHIKT